MRNTVRTTKWGWIQYQRRELTTGINIKFPSIRFGSIRFDLIRTINEEERHGFRIRSTGAICDDGKSREWRVHNAHE